MAFWDLATWDWSTIGKTAFGAGVGTALVQGGLSIYQDHKRRVAHAGYLAMRLAVMLEQYGAECSEFIGENSNPPHRPGEEFPEWNVSLPTLAPFPVDDDGWRALDQKLAAQILNLPNRIRTSQGLIGSTLEYSPDEAGEVLQIEAADRGLEAWGAATLLRRRHRIEPAEPLWDYAERLIQMRGVAQAELDDARKNDAEAMEKLFADVPPIAPTTSEQEVVVTESRKTD